MIGSAVERNIPSAYESEKGREKVEQQIIDFAVRGIFISLQFDDNSTLNQKLEWAIQRYPFLESLITSEDIESIPSEKDKSSLLNKFLNHDNPDDLVGLLLKNIWLIPFLSTERDPSEYWKGIDPNKPDKVRVPCDLQVLNSFLIRLESENSELFRKCSLGILRQLESLLDLMDFKWMSRLFASLRISDEELWMEEIGLEEQEYNFYLKMASFMEAGQEFIGEVSRLAKDDRTVFKARTFDVLGSPLRNGVRYSNPGKKERFLPKIELKSIVSGFPKLEKKIEKAEWLEFESELLDFISNKVHHPNFHALENEVSKFVRFIDPSQKGKEEQGKYFLPYPFILNSLRKRIVESFGKKILHEQGIGAVERRTTDRRYQDYDENILLSYLILRRLLFPREALTTISRDSVPAHVDLANVYNSSAESFDKYSESRQLEESGYRKGMILIIINFLKLEDPNVYGYGIGGGWLFKQLVESGLNVNGLEIDDKLFEMAKKKFDDIEGRKRGSLYKGSWDDPSEWKELVERDKNKPSLFFWMGRSASHEESEEAFVTTLQNFAGYMELGDFLMLDMPDPESGDYNERILEMIDGFNSILGEYYPELMIDRDEFDYLVDSPDGKNNYNRYAPVYKKLVKIFKLLGFEIIDVDLGDIGREKGGFRHGIGQNQEAKPLAIIERVNASPLEGVRNNPGIEERMNNRRNMVFVLKKNKDVGRVYANPKKFTRQTVKREII